MLERKRRGKQFDFGTGDDADLELGEGIGEQETGVTREHTLEEEVDNWDENAADWEEEEPTAAATETDGEGLKTPRSSVDDVVDVKRRND
jgi:hypothetical protein